MKPHYASIRKVKTKSGSTAVQVGKYKGKRFKLIKHIGSAKGQKKTDELLEIASEYIRSHSQQQCLDFNPHSKEILYRRGIHAQKSRLSTAYNYLESVYQKLGFNCLNNDLLKHFVMIRVLEPASKAKSLTLLKKYFGLEYKKTTTFRRLQQLVDIKEDVIKLTVGYAKKHLGFDFSLVFYDVTTLYFETFKEDEENFRKIGFSKDNKINQPQVLVGLMVNQTGFPVYYDIFPGNTFEGHTIIPVVTKLVAKYNIGKLTVVADAGMLSEDNLRSLEENRIDYIVGARIKNLKLEEVKLISQKLGNIDGQIVRQGSFIYEYLEKRAKKDKSDNDRQLAKAKFLISHPGKVLKRSKFLTSSKNKAFILNTETVKKYRLLEGIKSYRTNVTNVADQILVDRYKDLWHVEQSFRIAKSDLAARPIYHRKEDSIKYHLLIVFMALCLSKVIEQERKISIQKVVDELKDVWTVTLEDEISGNTLDVTINTKPH